MAKSELDRDASWKYNKNFIDWVVSVTEESVKKGGLAEEAIQHLKNRSLDSILNLKDGAKAHKHRAKHMLGAIKIIRGLS